MNTASLFTKSLQDVVKGLRSQPTAEGRDAYAAQALAECRVELASVDHALKANAASKVAHLRMLGYDAHNIGDDDTSFHVIEAMVSPQFKYKRLGNLAASRILTPSSRVLLLATNSLKKELANPDPHVSGLALGAISCFVSKDLARDLLPDVLHCLQSAKPYVRKRAMLCVLRMCQAYPEGLLDAYGAMRARLDDSDPSVVGCAVSVVCELSRSNSKSVLPLTPQLYSLLTTSSNNWMLIKIVKLYSALIAVEPRLARKLLDPLGHIIRTTTAKSLLYECVSTTTRALRHCPTAPANLISDLVSLCASKLKEFILDSDQNLKYLGLVGFIELTKSHPAIASEYKELIVMCLGDDDVTVRLRALELLAGIATPKSVMGIVKCILEQVHRAGPGKFRDAVAPSIVLACVGPDHDLTRLPSCEWYIAVLMDLARASEANGPLLASQLVSVVTSVPSVQDFCSETSAKLLFESKPVGPDMFAAAVFCACEFAPESRSPSESARIVDKLCDASVEWPELVRAVLVHNAVKVALKSGNALFKAKTADLVKPWTLSLCAEIQERAVLGLEMLASQGSLFDHKLGPVHPEAQLQVPLPLGLDLDLSFLPKEDKPEGVPLAAALSFRGVKALVPTQRAEVVTRNESSPFYLSSKSSPLQQQQHRQPVAGSQEVEEMDYDEELVEDEARSSSSKLWSAGLAKSQPQQQQHQAVVVVVKPALPEGAVPVLPATALTPEKGDLTLADIDVWQERASGRLVVAAKEEEDAKTKKKKKKKKGDDDDNGPRKKDKKKKGEDKGEGNLIDL